MGSRQQQCPLVTAGDVIGGHYCSDNARSPRMPADDVTSGHQRALQLQLPATRDSLPDALRWWKYTMPIQNNMPSMQLSTKPAKKSRTVYGQNGDKPKQHLQF